MSGKIAKKDKVLIAPVSGKECVYYHTVCEQEVQKTRPVTRDGRQEIQTYYEWVHKFTDTDCVDFMLVDASNPKYKIVVPVEASSLKSHSSVDAFKKNYSQGSNYPGHLTVRPIFDMNMSTIIFILLLCVQSLSKSLDR